MYGVGSVSSVATHSWYVGKPVRDVCRRVMLVTGTVGENQPVSPSVLLPEPVSSCVPAFHVGSGPLALA